MKGELFTMARKIPFSPPDITQAEIDEVADTLRSGWITTGPKTKRFEKELSAFMGTPCTAALNSATAALECALRVLGVGPGDEVITSAYTYTSSASCILHVGATPVMCDVKPGTYEMDYDRLPELITDKTRAIIPVDLAGRMIDYDRLFEVLDSVSASWKPQTDIQSAYTRIPVLADGAHSFGASYHCVTSGKRRRLHGVLVPRREEPDHGRRRRAHVARGRLRFRRGLQGSHAHVAARPEQGRPRQDACRRMGIRHQVPRLEM
jgi:dTDP-4-amino-4,6-dideoxygalactose transaminase